MKREVTALSPRVAEGTTELNSAWHRTVEHESGQWLVLCALVVGIGYLCALVLTRGRKLSKSMADRPATASEPCQGCPACLWSSSKHRCAALPTDFYKGGLGPHRS